MLSTDSMKFLSKCQWHIPQNRNKYFLKLYGTQIDKTILRWNGEGGGRRVQDGEHMYKNKKKLKKKKQH